ncbi:ATP synthase subunit I [Kineococcus sp. SYSU DK003]|uniref:ATP synthase subunit I n=1 Tax=Kineococcus sp. SYSU DK003 TaxID=3383124 RepID=UPI003D7EF50F
MSTSTDAGVQASEAFGVLLRRASLISGIAALVCVVVAAVWQGVGAGLSALLGGAIVVGFFGARLVVMRKVTEKNPHMIMLTAMVVYSVKVVLLGVAMLLLIRVEGISGPALGFTVIITAVVWLAAELRAFMTMRIPVFMSDEGRK